MAKNTNEPKVFDPSKDSYSDIRPVPEETNSFEQTKQVPPEYSRVNIPNPTGSHAAFLDAAGQIAASGVRRQIEATLGSTGVNPFKAAKLAETAISTPQNQSKIIEAVSSAKQKAFTESNKVIARKLEAKRQSSAAAAAAHQQNHEAELERVRQDYASGKRTLPKYMAAQGQILEKNDAGLYGTAKLAGHVDDAAAGSSYEFGLSNGNHGPLGDSTIKTLNKDEQRRVVATHVKLGIPLSPYQKSVHKDAVLDVVASSNRHMVKNRQLTKFDKWTPGSEYNSSIVVHSSPELGDITLGDMVNHLNASIPDAPKSEKTPAPQKERIVTPWTDSEREALDVRNKAAVKKLTGKKLVSEMTAEERVDAAAAAAKKAPKGVLDIAAEAAKKSSPKTEEDIQSEQSSEARKLARMEAAIAHARGTRAQAKADYLANTARAPKESLEEKRAKVVMPDEKPQKTLEQELGLK